MRKVSSFVLVAGLILAATGFGVWAASRTTNPANVDTHGVLPVGGRMSVLPPVSGAAGVARPWVRAALARSGRIQPAVGQTAAIPCYRLNAHERSSGKEKVASR